MQQSLTPLYHPSSNPEERRNRDLKIQLSILVADNHTKWDEMLPTVRFAMNSATNRSTGYSPAYLAFARELRTPTDVHRDLRAVIENDNIVPEITPYLKKHIETLLRARETNELRQDSSKRYADRRCRETPLYLPGDKILVDTHVLSKSSAAYTSKFAPRRDGPYVIHRQVTPTTYEVSSLTDPDIPLGKYHASAIHPFIEDDISRDAEPIRPLRRRGRPRKDPVDSETCSSDSEPDNLPTNADISKEGRPERNRQLPKRYRDGAELIDFDM